MIYLYTIASPARSGTKWFSKVFTIDYSFCYHELTTHLHPFPSNVALDDWLIEQVEDYDYESAQRRWILQCYPDYFARLWERALYGQHIVGNSDNFTLRFLPGLWLLWPDMKFVFSARNGINVVHSRFIHETKTPISYRANWKKRWGSDDFFTLCCHNWVAEIADWKKSKDWLRARAQCLETRFEKVTKDPAELRGVWDWIGFGNWEKNEKRNRELMATPVNARVNTQQIHTPEDIWRMWTEEQREIFKKTCGDTIKTLGYSIPEVR